jgi:hypothetical protein
MLSTSVDRLFYVSSEGGPFLCEKLRSSERTMNRFPENLDLFTNEEYLVTTETWQCCLCPKNMIFTSHISSNAIDLEYIALVVLLWSYMDK